MAEIEIRVMRRQCLDRRIDNRDLLETEVRAWERRRTESGAKIRRRFSTEHARVKMAKSYPTLSLKESYSLRRDTRLPSLPVRNTGLAI